MGRKKGSRADRIFSNPRQTQLSQRFNRIVGRKVWSTGMVLRYDHFELETGE